MLLARDFFSAKPLAFQNAFRVESNDLIHNHTVVRSDSDENRVNKVSDP